MHSFTPLGTIEMVWNLPNKSLLKCTPSWTQLADLKSVTANAVVRKFTYEARQIEKDGYTKTLRCFYAAKESTFAYTLFIV